MIQRSRDMTGAAKVRQPVQDTASSPAECGREFVHRTFISKRIEDGSSLAPVMRRAILIARSAIGCRDRIIITGLATKCSGLILLGSYHGVVESRTKVTLTVQPAASASLESVDNWRSAQRSARFTVTGEVSASLASLA